MCGPNVARKALPATGKLEAIETEAQRNLRLGTILGSLSLALTVASFSLTMPHLQGRRDALQCDTLCLGSMTSARSALSLLGGFFISRLSDSNTSFLATTVGGGSGRKGCLYIGTVASVIGLVVGATTFSIRGMWLSMIPGSLFQQNFSVLKALLADYHEAIADDEALAGKNTSDSSSAASARAGSVGKLGMSVGLAFMVGPLLGATLVKSYEVAVAVAIALTLVSMLIIAKLPHAVRNSQKKKGKAKNMSQNGILSFLDVKAARSPSAVFIMAVRVCMALAFHIFQTIWTVSLKQRFEFGPSDHGKFMSFIGLTYALSQGLVAKRVVKPLGPRGRVRVIQLSCVALGVGRYVAFQTSSLVAVYAMFAFIVTALGVMNTILTSDTSTLASPEEIGGLYGVLESVESVAGMVGPIAGGILAMVHPIKAPLASVVGLYGVVFVLVSFGYDRLIIRGRLSTKKDE